VRLLARAYWGALGTFSEYQTMNDQTHNGWTNYATWRVNLEVFDGMNLRDHFDAIPDLYEVSNWAEQYADEVISAALPEMTSLHLSRHLTPHDIVDGWARAFLANVDWRMIASHLIENASEVDA
jgi:hypothetical protein